MTCARWRVSAICAAAGLAVAVPAAAQPDEPQRPPTSLSSPADQQAVFRAALATVRPCIVRIETIGGAQPVQAAERGGEEVVTTRFRQADGPTTGVIWTTDGYVLTSSFNFIRDPSIITVALHDGRRFVARLVARDRPARLALLKIEAADLPAPVRAPSSALRVGQWALTAGFGHGGDAPALSVGIVSALERSNGMTIQTDAKTSPANYGGPLFDIEGRVAGICVPMGQSMDEIAGVDWYDSGIGFAATADRIERHLPRLQQGQDVERGFMGIGLVQREAAVPEQLAQTLGVWTAMPVAAGPRGPAITAGLREGDLITHLDDRPTPRVAELRKVLWRKGAGETIRVRYIRGDEVHETDVVLGRLDDFKEPPQPAGSQPAAPTDTRPASQPAGGVGSP